MGRLSNSLKAAIESSGNTRAEICKMSGVEPASLSKYLNGNTVPKKDQLGRLARVLPAKHISLIYLAYIRDVLPEDVEDYVFFNAPTGQAENDENGYAEYKFEQEVELPQELESAFTELRRKAVESPAVADMILTSYRVICGVEK